MVDFSVICTVKNEENTIDLLLGSLLNQSLPPNEIIIVDGGSTDNTPDIIQSYQLHSSIPINYIFQKGINISKGRNIAIKNSKFEFIACIDGGCRADKYWLEKLIKPFQNDESIDVVAGFYLPDGKTPFEEVIGLLLFPDINIIDEKLFLPSGRSIAFKKECWQKVGGYPEWLQTAEDTLFDLNLIKAGYKFSFARDAIVYWRPRSNYRSLFRQYFYYAKGAVLANITTTIYQPYGQSFIKYIYFKIKFTCIDLFKTGKGLHVFFIPFILLDIFLAKILGTISGKIAFRNKKGAK
jgi:glycosyltransferase involved in cell wall biosynthesis